MFVIITCYRLVNYSKGNNSSGWEELTETLHSRAFHTSAVTKDGEILLVCPTLLHSVTLMIRCSQMMLKDDQMMQKDDQYRRPTNKKKIIYSNWLGHHLLCESTSSPNLDLFFFDWWSLVVKNYGADLSRGKAKACKNLRLSFFQYRKQYY